jgi:cadmium resistance protein CadD (predicted permease)
MLNFIKKIGFFRLLLSPIAIAILITAYQQQIWEMGLVGLIILGFGLMNKCLLSGKCETDFDHNSNTKVR